MNKNYKNGNENTEKTEDEVVKEFVFVDTPMLRASLRFTGLGDDINTVPDLKEYLKQRLADEHANIEEQDMCEHYIQIIEFYETRAKEKGTGEDFTVIVRKNNHIL